MSESPPPPQPPPPPPPPAQHNDDPSATKPWWKRWWSIAAIVLVVLFVIAGVTGETDEEADESEPVAEDVEQPDEIDPDNEAVEEEPSAAEDDEPADETATTLPNTPQAYTSLYTEGTNPAVADSDDVALIVGQAYRTWFTFVVYNGTTAPVSRIEVSGRAIDADGNTLGSGNSQRVEPNVIEPGGVAFGTVWIGEDLPDGARLDGAQVDYTDGLGRFENKVQIDIDELEILEEQITGIVSNPHDIEVSGPISVTVACLGDDGIPAAVVDSFADRDDIEAGGTSTFTIRLFDPFNCAGILAGSSGFDM